MDKKITAFGEIMLRLTPFEKSTVLLAKSFEACYGGSESNVLVALAALGHKTDYITALPDNSLGMAALHHLRSFGVGVDNIIVRGDRMGLYFLEEGFGERPTKVIYNRKGSEVSNLSENDVDYDRVFDDCKIFHISGISFALSESSRALAFRFLEEAKARNITVSFDFNYRASLWSEKEAEEVFRRIIPFVDILFCSERDLVSFLQTTCDDFYNYYDCRYVFVREREVIDGAMHKVSVNLYNKEKGLIASGSKAFPVMERIGGGDAFTAGALHILSNDMDSYEDALSYAIALFVLKHTVKGDVISLDAGSVNAYLSNNSKDVRR
ncbi:MAG: sugar kinase [Clostridia bacterium]|nr:sugar kinase [Clostridia bacterium]